jgi:ribosome-associated translation inhibitor RaiA
MLLQQVEEHSKEFEDRWTSERTDRIQRLEELEDQIIRNEARLALEQKKYEERIEIELTSLKEELAIEADERQAQDEDIVAALNRYTQQLQQSLSILSSD